MHFNALAQSFAVSFLEVTMDQPMKLFSRSEYILFISFRLCVDYSEYNYLASMCIHVTHLIDCCMNYEVSFQLCVMGDRTQSINVITFNSSLYKYIHVRTVLNTKRVENAVFQSLNIFSVMVHAIETQNIPT